MTLQDSTLSLPATVELVNLEEVVSRESLYISRKGRGSGTGKDFYLYLSSFYASFNMLQSYLERLYS